MPYSALLLPLKKDTATNKFPKLATMKALYQKEMELLIDSFLVLGLSEKNQLLRNIEPNPKLNELNENLNNPHEELSAALLTGRNPYLVHSDAADDAGDVNAERV